MRRVGMGEQPQSENEQLIDVERLVGELRERVERERAAGRYGDDVGSVPLRPLDDNASTVGLDQTLAQFPPPPQIVYRPELGYSSRRVVGPVLSAFKRLFYRLFAYPLDDLARQTDEAVRDLYVARRQLEAAVAVTARQEDLAATRDALMGRVDTLVNQLELVDRLEARQRESVQRDVKDVAARLAELEGAVERLELPSRLARLERVSRNVSASRAPAAAVPPREGVQQLPDFDYMTFENRFRPEASVRERHTTYVELLRGRKRVVDVGCGRGELLELLREVGVSAYGVDVADDVIAVCREKELEVVDGDAVAHLEALDKGAVDGIVASHIVEHLAPDRLWRLISAAAETVADGGILVVETPNPESLLAGSVNFHRDPTHVRPVHPDTLSFLCESAGFARVEIRRLAPVPEEERLRQPSTGDGRLAEEVGEIVTQLNDLIYGYQDYALIARL